MAKPSNEVIEVPRRSHGEKEREFIGENEKSETRNNGGVIFRLYGRNNLDRLPAWQHHHQPASMTMCDCGEPKSMS